MPSTSRIRTLADSTSLSLGMGGTGRYFLPQGGTLTSVTVTLGSASQGPCYANAAIAVHNDLGDILSLGSPRWVRGDSQFGLRETFVWKGEYDMNLTGEKDSILVIIRNNSGTTVGVIISWTWHR